MICYICAFVLGMKQLREPDIWWQLLTGRWMLENGEVTKTDMFSYTMEGAKWVNVKWLYEVLIAFMEKGLGPHAVMLLQSLVNVAIVYLLLRVLTSITKHLGEQVSTLFSTVAVLLFLAISEFRMAGRPEMISHLMAVVYMFILWQSKDFSWKRILWLIPLQCLWANMHEGYPVGMVIIGVYIGGAAIAHLLDKSKDYLQSAIRIGIVWLGMGVAVLINPNFTELWQHAAEIFRQLSANKYTTELFTAMQPEYWTIQGKVHVALLVLVCLFWIVRLVQNRKTKDGLVLNPLLIGYLFSILVMGYLSLTAYRNIPFAQIVLFPSLPIMFVWLVKTMKLQDKTAYTAAAKRTVLISSVLAFAFYVSVVSNEYYTFTKSANKYGIHLNTLSNPTSASDFIKRHNLKGPAFSDYFVSSYLLWDLYPQFKSYIDLRDLDIFPADFFADYFKLYNQPQKFYELDSVHKFNYIVLSTSQMTSLQELLYWQEGFNVVHVDPVAVILLRDIEENMPINRGPAAQQLFTWPQEHIDPGWAQALTTLFNPKISYEEEDRKNEPIHAGKFYNLVQNYRITVKLMRSAVLSDFWDDPDALTILGQSYLGDAEFSDQAEQKRLKQDTARMYFERSVELDKENSSTYLGLASLALTNGDFAGARIHLARYKELDNKNDFVYYMDGICARNIWYQGGGNSPLKDAIKSLERSAELNETNRKTYLYLAETYWADGQKDKSRENIMKVLSNDIRWSPQEKRVLDTMIVKNGVEQFTSPLEIIDTGAEHHHNHNH